MAVLKYTILVSNLLGKGSPKSQTPYYTTAVDKLEEVADSLCVGQKINDGGDERVVLFLKMAGGRSLDEALTTRVTMEIRKELSARHVPAVILEIADIPVSGIYRIIDFRNQKLFSEVLL